MRSATLLRLAAQALRENLSLLHEQWQGSSVHIFIFGSTSELERLVGRKTNGFVNPGEDTILLVYDGKRPPVLRHELMHVVVNHVWGVAPGTRDWLSEGIATWSTGGCQGSSFLQLAAGLNREKPLPSLELLAKEFRKLDELTAFIEAASVVDVVVHRYGVGTLRSAWKAPSIREPSLGPLGPRVEKTWRDAVQTTQPSIVNRARIETIGCEQATQ